MDDLNTQLEARGLRIHTIFAPDAPHQGASGLVNDELLGDGPCWHDLGRDILQLVNHFSAHLTHPIIGIGHSYGGHAILRASIMHPSLFTGVILLDPVVQSYKYKNPGMMPAVASSRRVDTWKSKEEAVKYFSSRPFYQAWDPRILPLHMKYGLRDAGKGDGSVTLTTSRYQEVFTFLDCTVENPPGPRTEPAETFSLLPLVKPPTIYIVGQYSPFTSDDLNQDKLTLTPNSEMSIIPNVGHLVAQENPTACAEFSGEFLAKIIPKWLEVAEKDARTPRQRNEFSPDTLKGLKRMGEEAIELMKADKAAKKVAKEAKAKL